MSNKSVLISLIAALAALTLPGAAQAQQGVRANLTGTYRCQPEPSPCPWPNQTMAIAQTGTALELKNDQGAFADAKATSDITVSGGPPWNALGLVLPDHSIQWSNGTKWLKQ
jgi:hypothetical protein